MREFHLEKWYLDAADSSGRAFIGYAAKLQWKSISLYYSGFTLLNSARQIEKQNNFSVDALPSLSNSSIHWETKFCKKASWQKIDNSIREILLNNEDNRIEWNCLFPKAIANIEVGEEKLKNALGYVEKIDIHILPWNIPILELHWGRFLSAHHTIVWIKWIGPVPKDLLFHNGKRMDNAVIGKSELTFNDHRLSLDNSISMRKGTLLTNVFSKFPSIAKVFPRSILNLQENKWVSEGTLESDGKLMCVGSAIHEIVRW